MTALSSETLRAISKEAGYDLCGFARAEPIPPEHLTRWLEAGFAVDMDWMGARVEERLDVRKLLPGAQTVIAFACNFYRGGRPRGRTRRSPATPAAATTTTTCATGCARSAGCSS